MKGRLLTTVLDDPFSNVALEQALFEEMRGPVLRVWENQKAVVIGRAQRAEFETDLDYCRANSIPVVRRMTGGGAVYHGPGNLNWSFFIPGGGEAVLDAKGVFTSFAGVLVDALRRCGRDCAFVPPNSIWNEKGKVSGMAAFISTRGTLCHGTLLVSADLGEVQRLTKPREAEVQRKYARSNFVPVSNCGIEQDILVERLVRASGHHLEPSGLTGPERERTESLLAKYRSHQWNLGDPFSL